MSESTHTARRRHEYLPNRMFDPVANPFAVQNLLVREEQPFAITPDGRPEFSFESDPTINKEGPGAFALDEVIELADLSGATAFAAETPGESAFVAESPSSTEPSATDSEFTADAAMTAHSAAAFTETTEQGDHAADVQAQSPHDLADETAPTDNTLENAVAEADATIDVAATANAEDEPVAEEDAMAVGAHTEAVDEQITTPEAAAEPEPHPALTPEAPAVASTPAVPDLSGEAVTALVEAAREEARAEARALAYQEGLAAGKAEATAALQKEHETQITQLKTLQEALKKLSFDADALFEPVKKLTVHLAEQLVRGELAQSPQVISRLVDNSLRELNASGEKAVIVHLNPEDLEAYRPLVAQFGDSIILRPDSLLERGSVRVALDGSVVEDLMQRRIDGLKKSLNQPAAPSWQAGGARLADRLSDTQRGSQHVEDVTAVETTGDDDVSDD